MAYGHLAAGDDTAYALGAADALYWSALQHFRGRVRWLDFGAGAGIASDGRDGLSSFKREWATSSRPVFFCGRILDAPRYAQILHERRVPPTDYFPAYRQGEFMRAASSADTAAPVGNVSRQSVRRSVCGSRVGGVEEQPEPVSTGNAREGLDVAGPPPQVDAQDRGGPIGD